MRRAPQPARVAGSHFGTRDDADREDGLVESLPGGVGPVSDALGARGRPLHQADEARVTEQDLRVGHAL